MTFEHNAQHNTPNTKPRLSKMLRRRRPLIMFMTLLGFILSTAYALYMPAPKSNAPSTARTEFNDRIAHETENLSALLERYGEKHPKIIAARKTIHDLKKQQNTLIAATAQQTQSAAWLPALFKTEMPLACIALFIGLSTLGAFLIGAVLAVLLEKTRKAYLSGREIERETGLYCSGLIPALSLKKEEKLSTCLLKNPSSAAADAVRGVRVMSDIIGKHDANTGQVIALTSSFPNEGKTVLSLHLAQLAAQAGEKVLLIDADMRRPSLHHLMEQDNTKSLIEHLTGQLPLDAVINKSDASGLNVIYGRALPNSALDLASSDKIKRLIDDLRTSYDLIIIDTPACMAAADSYAICRHADHVLYAARWNKTDKTIIHNGVSQFQKIFGNAITRKFSIVLTRVDLKKYVSLGFGDVVEYYADY